MANIELIRGVFLFNGLSDEEFASVYPIISDLREHRFSDGERIACDASSIGLVLSGKAQIVKSGANPVLLRLISDGDIFGAGALFSEDAPLRTDVIAKGNASAVFFTKDIVEKLFLAVPAISKNYIIYLSGRIIFLNRRIEAFTAGDADAKVAFYLTELCKNSSEINLPDSYTSIAKKLDIGRASLYRTLDKFASDGIISRSGSKVLILKPEGLLKILK